MTRDGLLYLLDLAGQALAERDAEILSLRKQLEVLLQARERQEERRESVPAQS